MKGTGKPDGLRPGDRYHGGLTVLSCSATRDNRGNNPRMVLHAYTNKISHKPLTQIQQTVNILTIEHVYRYDTLLLGVRVCLGGVRIDT